MCADMNGVVIGDQQLVEVCESGACDGFDEDAAWDGARRNRLANDKGWPTHTHTLSLARALVSKHPFHK